jgi:hypothetical protein
VPRLLWWGEAPERPHRFRNETGIHLSTEYARSNQRAEPSCKAGHRFDSALFALSPVSRLAHSFIFLDPAGGSAFPYGRRSEEVIFLDELVENTLSHGVQRSKDATPFGGNRFVATGAPTAVVQQKI